MAAKTPISQYSYPRNIGSRSKWYLGVPHNIADVQNTDDWEKKAAQLYQAINTGQIIVEPSQTPYVSPDNPGHAGPRVSIPGLLGLTGSIETTIGDTLYGRLWEWFLGQAAETRVDVVFAAAANAKMKTGNYAIPTSGVGPAIEANKQPKDLLAATTDANSDDLNQLNCAQIKFTAGFANGDTLTVRGEDAKERTISEKKVFGSSATSYTTTKYFRTVKSITFKKAAGADHSLAVTDLSIVPNVKKYPFRINDKGPGRRAIEAVYDNAVFTYIGMIPTQLTMNFAEAITATFDLLGHRPFFNETMLGHQTLGNTQRTNDSAYKTRKQRFMADFATEFIIGEAETFAAAAKFINGNVDLTINHNLTDNPIQNGSGSAYAAPPVQGDEPRVINLNTTINFDERNEFASRSLGEVVSAIVRYATIPLGDRPTIHVFKFPRCTFGSPATPDLTGGASIPERIELLPYATAPGNDFTLDIYGTTDETEVLPSGVAPILTT